MEDKPTGRRPSGSGETKQKGKSSKKKRKNKTKDRERKRTTVPTGKAASPEETNSDSAVDFGRLKTRETSESKSIPAELDAQFGEASTGKRKTSKSKRKLKGSQSHTSEKTRTKLTGKNSLSSLQNSTGVQSAPVLGMRSISSSGISLLDKKGIMDINALFPSGSEPNKLAVSASHSSADSELSEVAEMVDESLRWENSASDPEEEAERIRLYKINRRKRYLIDAYQKRDDKEGVLKLAKELAGCRDDKW